MSNLLEVKNLDVKFDTDEGRITAVENISFTLQQGKPNDDIGSVMHLLLWPFFMSLFIIGFINGQNNE